MNRVWLLLLALLPAGCTIPAHAESVTLADLKQRGADVSVSLAGGTVSVNLTTQADSAHCPALGPEATAVLNGAGTSSVKLGGTSFGRELKLQGGGKIGIPIETAGCGEIGFHFDAPSDVTDDTFHLDVRLQDRSGTFTVQGTGVFAPFSARLTNPSSSTTVHRGQSVELTLSPPLPPGHVITVDFYELGLHVPATLSTPAQVVFDVPSTAPTGLARVDVFADGTSADVYGYRTFDQCDFSQCGADVLDNVQTYPPVLVTIAE